MDQQYQEWAAARGNVAADRILREASEARARHDGAYRGRRMSWAEFFTLRPDLKPAANDNEPRAEAA